MFEANSFLNPLSPLSRMNQKEKELLNLSNGTKTDHQTMSNSCISTDKSPSLSKQHKAASSPREVNELISNMINSLEASNSQMRRTVQPSIDLCVYDHLNQIKQDLANGKIKPQSKTEEESDKSLIDNGNPYVYPNSYNLLSDSKRYEILAEIRDRTDERVLQYETVLEKLYKNLVICDNKSPYLNIVNEQKKKLIISLKGKDKHELKDQSGSCNSTQRIANEEITTSGQTGVTRLFHRGNTSCENEGNSNNNSFEKNHSKDMFQMIIIDKDKKKKLNQGSFVIRTNSQKKKKHHYNKKDQPMPSTQHNSTQLLHRNQSAGSFIDKDNKSIQFYDKKSKQANDVSQGENLIYIDESFGKQSPLSKQMQRID